MAHMQTSGTRVAASPLGWALPAVFTSCAYVKPRVNLVIIKCRNLGLAGFSFFVCTILQSAIFRNG